MRAAPVCATVSSSGSRPDAHTCCGSVVLPASVMGTVQGSRATSCAHAPEGQSEAGKGRLHRKSPRECVRQSRYTLVRTLAANDREGHRVVQHVAGIRVA